MTGTLNSRISKAAFTFAIASAIILASTSLRTSAVVARPAVRPDQGAPMPASIVTPNQHRGPAQPVVHRDPQPLTPISVPIVSAPIVSAPAVPAPAIQPSPTVNRLEPLRINPAERQQIIASHADAMRKEHCLRKLEARQRILRERRAQH